MEHMINVINSKLFTKNNHNDSIFTKTDKLLVLIVGSIIHVQIWYQHVRLQSIKIETHCIMIFITRDFFLSSDIITYTVISVNFDFTRYT